MSTEDILTQTLAERAEATQYDATPLATVAGRARRIRRGRRTAAGAAAVAAALAITVPAVVVGGGGDTGTPEPLGSDGPPAVGYAVDGVYHRADGTTVDLPAGTWSSVTELSGGGLIVLSSEGTMPSVELDADGATVAEWCTSTVTVTTGRTVAWAERPCDRPRRIDVVVDGPDGRSSHRVTRWDPDLRGVDDDGDVVYFNGADARLLRADGTDRVIPGFAHPTDYDPVNRLVSGQLDEPGVVGGVADLDGRVIWRQSGLSAGFFSPDGNRLIGVEGGLSLDQAVQSAADGRVVEDLPEIAATSTLVWHDGLPVEVTAPPGVGPDEIVWQTLP